jgi:integrase
MRVQVGSRQQLIRAYLSELLDLANETGRRLSAILNLRYENLGLTRTAAAPHGVVTWPADTDKLGRAWSDVPLSAVARAAIDRVLAERPGIGSAPLFPAPMNPSQSMSRHLADAWLRKAESLAGLEPQPGSLWHAFRRKAATELKGAPDKDVMALLGWKDLQSLKTAYQQADPETMLVALENRHELRQLAQ